MNPADWIGSARSLTQSSSIPLGVPINTHMDMLLRDTRRDLRTACDALEAVLALHCPDEQEALDWDCGNGVCCGHEDECPTHPVLICRECERVAADVDEWFAETSVGPALFPCPTVTAITEALS